MTPNRNSFFYIPGSGGGIPDLSALNGASNETMSFEAVRYPGWRRCVAANFSADVLVSELSKEVEARAPIGPLRIVGLSLGGHFAYLVALHLQAKGREIETVCAIDSFIVSTAQPTPGWQRRALTEFLELLRGCRMGELLRFGRSRFWRAILRIIGEKLPHVLRNLSRINWLSRACEIDPILKEELDMRMLTRVVAPWLATVDNDPVALTVPVALVRTKYTASSDAAWRARCPHLAVFEIEGSHHTLFEPENIGALRDAFNAATRVYSTSNV